MKAIPKRDLINIIDSLNIKDDKPVFDSTIKNIFEKFGDEYYYDHGDSYGDPELCVDKSDIRREALKEFGEDAK